MIPLLLALAAGPRPCLAFLPSDAKEIPTCVSTDARGGMVVGTAARKQLAFRDGLATISIDGAFFYVDQNGQTARALAFDNGPDPFVEGLARTIENGKVGFLDRKLRAVIAPQWDFAFPFRGGLAVVCNGCRAEAGDEHHRVTGGLWGYVDRKGHAAVPVEYPEDKLPSHEDALRLIRK